VPNALTGSGCGSYVNPGNPNAYIKTQCFAIPTAPNLAFWNANCIGGDSTSLQCFNLRGNLGRNTLTGPGLLNFDLSVVKNNYVKRVSDAFNVQFRTEFFNALNRANFAPPLDNRNIFDAKGAAIANAGLITSTQTPSRQIQLALKIIW
jgi:hypothetical protein